MAPLCTGPRLIDGRWLHAVVTGDGPAVLLVHGLGATTHIWDRVAPRLDGFTIVAVDLPGCGRSEAMRSGEGLAELAVALDALMAAEFGPYAVAGHSLGGVIALELALTCPARVKAAALINAAIRLPLIARVAGRRGIGDAIFKVPALTPASRVATKLYLMGIFGSTRAVTDEVVDNYLQAASAPGYYAGMLSGLRSLTTWTHGGRLASLRVPTAVIWGAKDPIFPLAEGRRVALSLPGARLHALAQSGHCPPEEQPELVAPILRELFASALGQRADGGGASPV